MMREDGHEFIIRRVHTYKSYCCCYFLKTLLELSVTVNFVTLFIIEKLKKQ